MRLLSKLCGSGIAALAFTAVTTFSLATVTTEVAAQEITSSISGTVLEPDGSPAAGVIATVTDSRDGRTQSATADANGVINFRAVKAGGPYTVRLSGDGLRSMTITDLNTNVAGTSSFTVSMEAEDASIEEIVVTAAQIETITTASGPSSSFSLEDINNMPSTQRQIRDVIRIDPRISIGETGDGGDQSGAISCAGGSSRTNSFTVDGVRATDAFGLNLSGNLARFTFPIPFDTVAAAAVEFAPMSVEYGQFSGCTINVVTKSGTNEFHGGGFYLYNDDGMTGDEIEGNEFNQGVFERKNWGVDIGGPILRDKLFFYAAYEEFDTASVNRFGAADDSSFPASNTSFTTAELETIRQTLINQYGRDPGEEVRNLPVVSERLFVRLDWNINDDHRVEGTFAQLDETTTIGDDIDGSRGGYTFSDNFHFRGSESDTFALRLYSDWTDRLSTEVRYSQQEVIDLQNPLGGGEAQDATPLPRIAIGFGNEFFGQNFASGPGTFRSANKLSTNKDQFKIKADYQLGDHLLTAGYEYETLDVFNLFIINATGSVFFDDIAALQAGTARDIRQGVSFTTDPNDAAAIYTRDINSFFLQDQWRISDRLELIFGLRYDEYQTDDLPTANASYIARYGITNAVSFDGLSAVQPRIGMNYTMPENWGDTRISAGFGIFSGNDPTVWFSNAYQNFGGALGVGDLSSCPAGSEQVLVGGSFTGVPQCVVDAGQQQALTNSAAVNATDPNFDLPTAHRYSFGVEHNTDLASGFLSDWNLRLDLIYTDLKDQIDFADLSLDQTGILTPDGRPTFQQIDPLLPGCAATFDGIGQGFSNVTPACLGGNQDVLFTNKTGDGGYTFTTSVQANKQFAWGDTWGLNLSLGYSYNESEIANAGTSFTAGTSFRSVIASDLLNAPVGASLRNTPHNFVIAGTLSNEFWSGYQTSMSFFLNRRAGNALSPTFVGQPFAGSIGDTGGRARSLLYVPTDGNDPFVNFDPAFDQNAFFAWTDAAGLARGAIAGKGSVEEDWQTDMDLRFQQEIPFPFFRDAKAKVFLDIENVLNLLNDDWGPKRYLNTADNAEAVAVVEASFDPVTGTYNYTDFSTRAIEPDLFDSLYRIQIGIRADF